MFYKKVIHYPEHGEHPDGHNHTCDQPIKDWHPLNQSPVKTVIM